VVGGCDPDDGLIRADWDFTTGQRSQKVHMKREGGLYGGYVGWRGREWGTVRERREKKEGMWIFSFSHMGTCTEAEHESKFPRCLSWPSCTLTASFSCKYIPKSISLFDHPEIFSLHKERPFMLKGWRPLPLEQCLL
jgi:hypothetical protein